MEKYSTEELLKLAESHYQKSEYDNALNVLMENRQIIESPSLWHFNVGSIYLKKNELGLARYHLEKSTHSFDVGKLAKKNINVLVKNDRIIDITKSNNTYENFIAQSLNLGVWDFGLMTILLVLANLIFFRLKRFRVMFLIVGLFISFTPLGYHHYIKRNLNIGIVIKDTPLREGPSKIYKENTTIPAGSKVIYGMTKNGWFLINKPSVINGWVEAKAVRSLRK